MPSIVDVSMPYVIDDIMKIKLATEWRHTSPYSDLSTNKSLSLTIDYIGDVCRNTDLILSLPLIQNALR